MPQATRSIGNPGFAKARSLSSFDWNRLTYNQVDGTPEDGSFKLYEDWELPNVGDLRNLSELILLSFTASYNWDYNWGNNLNIDLYHKDNVGGSTNPIVIENWSPLVDGGSASLVLSNAYDLLNASSRKQLGVSWTSGNFTASVSFSFKFYYKD